MRIFTCYDPQQRSKAMKKIVLGFLIAILGSEASVHFRLPIYSGISTPYILYLFIEAFTMLKAAEGFCCCM